MAIPGSPVWRRIRTRIFGKPAKFSGISVRVVRGGGWDWSIKSSQK